MSSAYQSMIDAALRNAQAMASTGVEKTASEPNDLYKEASELANALEYMAISSVDDGTAAGVAQSDIIKDFFKQASKQRMGVPHGSTAATGTQGVAPSQGKLKLNQTQNALHVSSSKDSTGNQMLESYKQASLYDILMGKQADSPAQYTADQYTNVTNANENSVRSVLDTNDSAANYTKRHVHGQNIRARLAEAFSNTNDTLSDETAQQIFPQAYAAGGLKKTASATRDRLNKVAMNLGQAGEMLGGLAQSGGLTGKAIEFAMRNPHATYGIGTGLAGAGVGAMSAAPEDRLRGALVGGALGGAAGYGGSRLAANRLGAGKLDQAVGAGLVLPGAALAATPFAYDRVRRNKAKQRGEKQANQFLNTVAGRALAGGGIGAAAGGVGGYMAGGDAGSAMTGAALGGLAGAAGGGLMQRSALKNVAKAEEAMAAHMAKAQKGNVPLGAAKSMPAPPPFAGGPKATPDQMKAFEEAMTKQKQLAENLAAAEAAAAGGRMSGAGVAGGAGVLAGLGGGMMARKEASSPLSARSRLRQMQRGL